MFECSEQHDCQEFVAFLLDQLHTSMYESNKSLHPSPEESEGTDSNKLSDSSKKKEADKEEADEEKAERSWTEYEKQNESLVTQLFTGQLRSRLICRTCQSSSSVFEPFTSLSLPIGFEDVDLYQVIGKNNTIWFTKIWKFQLYIETGESRVAMVSDCHVTRRLEISGKWLPYQVESRCHI